MNKTKNSTVVHNRNPGRQILFEHSAAVQFSFRFVLSEVIQINLSTPLPFHLRWIFQFLENSLKNAFTPISQASTMFP